MNNVFVGDLHINNMVYNHDLDGDTLSIHNYLKIPGFLDILMPGSLHVDIPVYCGTGRADNTFDDPVKSFVVNNYVGVEFAPNYIEGYRRFKEKIRRQIYEGRIILESINPYKDEIEDERASLPEILRLRKYVKEY